MRKYTKYTVRKNDTLWAIGRRHRIHWKKLAKLNHLEDPNWIYVGQELLIPIPKRHIFSIRKQPAPVFRIMETNKLNTGQYHCMIEIEGRIVYIFVDELQINNDRYIYNLALNELEGM